MKIRKRKKKRFDNVVFFLRSRGMNCLHVLASSSRENAHVIFGTLLEYHPHFPLDIREGQGHTALLLAYKFGHGHLCRALVTAGANLSICNDEGLSIFTLPAASKALLVNILGKNILSVRFLNFSICSIQM